MTTSRLGPGNVRPPELADLVVERVRRVLSDAVEVSVASDDTDLIGSGLLDSLALVELLLEIEREFAISFPLEELDVEHFGTVRSLATFVAELLPEATDRACGEA